MTVTTKVFKGKRNYINDCVNEYLDELQRKGVVVLTYSMEYAREGDSLIGRLVVTTTERKD